MISIHPISPLALFLLLVGLAISQLSFAAADDDIVLDVVANNTKQVVESSKLTNAAIRQCSCDEQNVCLRQMQSQVRDCFHSCWTQGDSKIPETANSQQLEQCFESREGLITAFVECVKNTGQTCVNTKAGPKITPVDLNRLLGAGEQKLKSQARAFMSSMSGQTKDLAEAAVNVGTCTKGCFAGKNAHASCFTRSGCSLKMEEDLISPVIKRCSRQINWKKEASGMCDCAFSAGVLALKPYCQLLSSSLEKN